VAGTIERAVDLSQICFCQRQTNRIEALCYCHHCHLLSSHLTIFEAIVIRSDGYVTQRGDFDATKKRAFRPRTYAIERPEHADVHSHGTARPRSAHDDHFQSALSQDRRVRRVAVEPRNGRLDGAGGAWAARTVRLCQTRLTKPQSRALSHVSLSERPLSPMPVGRNRRCRESRVVLRVIRG
jgi:hypothetical protein